MRTSLSRCVGVLFWAACGCQSATEEPQQSATPATTSLCPGCLGPTAGGETTDFAGDVGACSARGRRNVLSDDPQAIDLGVERYRALVEGASRVPFQWRRRLSGAQVSGFESSTMLELDVRVASVEIVDMAPTVSASREECPDKLQLRLDVDLHTEDGAWTQNATALAIPRGDDAVVAYPTTENTGLSEVTGTLSIRRDGALPSFGELEGTLWFFDSGPRGELMPWVRFEGSDESYQPIVGRWPSDGCDVGAYPIDEGTERVDLAGQSVTDVLAQVRDTFESFSPLPAQWVATGETAELSIGVSEPSIACFRLDWAAPGARAEVTLKTDDGRADVRVPMDFYFEAFGAPGTRYVDMLLEDLEPQSVSQFAAERGIADVQFPAEDLQVESWSRTVIEDFGEANRMEGILEVVGFDGQNARTRDALRWCAPAGCRAPQPRDAVLNEPATASGGGGNGSGGAGFLGEGGDSSGPAGGNGQGGNGVAPSAGGNAPLGSGGDGAGGNGVSVSAGGAGGRGVDAPPAGGSPQGGNSALPAN